MSYKVDNRLPNLVNLNEDPHLSEILLYILKEGEQQPADTSIVLLSLTRGNHCGLSESN